MSLFISEPDYIDIIARYYVGRDVSAGGPLYSDLIWGDGLDPIPQADLDALMLPCYKAVIDDAISGYTSTLIAQGYVYQGSLFSFAPPLSDTMQELMLILTSRNNLLPGFVWPDIGGTEHAMSQAEFCIFYNSLMLWTGVLFTLIGEKIGTVDALASIDACAAYDVAADWPASDTDVVAWLAANGYAPVTPRRIISALAFRRRLTATERGAITIAAATSLGAGDPTLQLYLDDLSSSTVVNLDDPETSAGLGALANAGLLDPTRISTLIADGVDSELVQT